MYRFYFFVLLSLFCSGKLMNAQENLVNNAEAYYLSNDYKEAFDLYSKCAELDTNHIECIEKAGMSAYRMGDVPSARSYFDKLLVLDTINLTALNQLSSIYEQEKNTPKAIKYYSKLNALFPENAFYLRKLGQQYHQAGLATEAFQYYAQTIKINERDMLALKGIAELFLSNRQFEEADSILHVALEMDSLNVSFNLLMAQCQYRKKEYDSTVHYLDNIRYQIDFSPYYNKMMGYAYMQIDSFTHSIPFLEKALMDDGSKEYAHYYLATAYEKLDSMEYALYHYQKALEEGISGNVDLYHRNLARLFDDQNNLKEAIDHYKDAYKYSDDPSLLFFLARASEIYYKDKTVAINYYKRYLKSNHDEEKYIMYSNQRLQLLKEELHFKM